MESVNSVDYVSSIPEDETSAEVMYNIWNISETIYKQKWCKDGYFLPAHCIHNANLKVVHMTSCKELRIIIRDSQNEMLYCNHKISHDFKFCQNQTFSVNMVSRGVLSSTLSWDAETENGQVYRMHVTNNCSDVFAILREAKKLALQYKEKFELQEAVRQQLLNQIDSNVHQSDEADGNQSESPKPIEEQSETSNSKSENTDSEETQSESSECSDNQSKCCETLGEKLDKILLQLESINLKMPNKVQPEASDKQIQSEEKEDNITQNIESTEQEALNTTEKPCVNVQEQNLEVSVIEQTFHDVQVLMDCIDQGECMKEKSQSGMDLQDKNLGDAIEELVHSEQDQGDVNIINTAVQDLEATDELSIHNTQELCEPTQVEPLNDVCQANDLYETRDNKDSKLLKLTAKVNNYKENIASKDAIIQILTSQIEDLNETCQKNETNIEELSKMLESKDGKIQELKLTGKSLNQKLNEKNIKIEDMSNLKIRMEERSDSDYIKIQKLYGELQSQENRIKHMSAKIKQFAIDKKMLETKLIAANSDKQILREEMKELKFEKDECESIIDAEDKKIHKLKQIIEEMKSECRNMEELIHDKNRDIQNYKKEVRRLQLIVNNQ